MGTGIFSLGTNAMFAAQRALNTTSHNISNANTEGYSRQSVGFATEGGMFTGAGFYGLGVRATTVTRATNEALSREFQRSTSTAFGDKARLSKLEQLENAIPLGETGLGYGASQLLNAFVDVSNQPSNMSARAVAISKAQEWVARVHTASAQLTEIQSGVVGDLSLNVAQVNSLTGQIANINQQIAAFKGSSHTPNDLLDTRDTLVNKLNQIVQVNTVEADDGSLNVFLGGGQLLVLSNSAQKLAVVSDPDNAELARVALETHNASTPGVPHYRVLDSAQLTGGAVSGLLKFQDLDLAPVRADLEAFVSQFAAAVDAQQMAGETEPGVNGQPIFGGGPYSSAGIQVTLTAPADLAASGSPYSSTDNANALAMLALRDQNIIQLNNMPASTLTDAYSQMVGNLGVLVQQGRTATEISEIVYQNAKQLLTSETGVNLDEEAANLIQYQQSYQAAAKILQVAQQVFDTLLTVGR